MVLMTDGELDPKLTKLVNIETRRYVTTLIALFNSGKSQKSWKRQLFDFQLFRNCTLGQRCKMITSNVEFPRLAKIPMRDFTRSLSNFLHCAWPMN